MKYALKTKNVWYRGKLTCKYCGKTFHHLGSHLWHRHKITAREYKEEFGLPFREALISAEIYLKKVDAFNEHRERYIRNLKKAGTKHQFKKGQSGARRISDAERVRIMERVKKMNDNHRIIRPCPVCRVKFNHVESHLYNKHKLLQV